MSGPTLSITGVVRYDSAHVSGELPLMPLSVALVGVRRAHPQTVVLSPDQVDVEVPSPSGGAATLLLITDRRIRIQLDGGPSITVDRLFINIGELSLVTLSNDMLTEARQVEATVLWVEGGVLT
jgi:hypothetical protein